MTHKHGLSFSREKYMNVFFFGRKKTSLEQNARRWQQCACAVQKALCWAGKWDLELRHISRDNSRVLNLTPKQVLPLLLLLFIELKTPKLFFLTQNDWRQKSGRKITFFEARVSYYFLVSFLCAKTHAREFNVQDGNYNISFSHAMHILIMQLYSMKKPHSFPNSQNIYQDYVFWLLFNSKSH